MAQTESYQSSKKDFLSSLVLETLNRKTDPDSFVSASKICFCSDRTTTFILDALLQSYPYVQLDFVLEQIFDMFSSLYRFAYKDAIELLSFKRKISATQRLKLVH